MSIFKKLRSNNVPKRYNEKQQESVTQKPESPALNFSF